MRLPIDYLFRSQAEVHGEKAIGIVLSGTGSDGTLGIKQIAAAGGMAIVQKAASADYDGMPRAAIATGMVDYLLPIDEMPERLTRYIHHPYRDRNERQQDFSESAPDHFKSILSLMQTHTDHDFRCYKKATLDRRIHRRMGLRQIEKLDDYLRLLRESEEELRSLIKDLPIGVTRFFREPKSWHKIAEEALTPLIDSKIVGFTIDDTHFLQAVANTLWLAISTARAQADIESERREPRQLADALPFQIAIVGADQHYRFNNKAYLERDLGLAAILT